jgi:hypothetical protein
MFFVSADSKESRERLAAKTKTPADAGATEYETKYYLSCTIRRKTLFVKRKAKVEEGFGGRRLP